MLEKSSIFMMLLVVAASMVGINGIHQLAIIHAQPQPLTPNAGQVLKQQQPPVAAQQQQQKPLRGIETICGPICVQAQEDQKLVDRLFPYIIQKIDANTLINKIGGKKLAEIVLPYLQVSVGASPVYTQRISVNKDIAAPDSYHTVSAMCPPGTKVFGGGGHVLDRSFNNPRNNAEDNQIVESGVGDRGGWKITGKMSSSGEVYGYALCGKATLSLVQ